VSTSWHILKPAQFKQEIDSMYDELRACAGLSGSHTTRSIEQNAREKSIAEGIGLPDSIMEELKGLVVEYGLECKI
jgi:LDH2 family malate/lactate/ureidoglycolate dehydrogenase